MKLEYIHEFVILSNYGNYSDTSEALFISQSVLSKHMHSLEEELNTRLFYRDKATKKTFLTESGQDFLSYAKNLDKTYQECLNFFSSNSNYGSITIGLGCHRYDIIDNYSQFNPTAKLHIIESASTEYLENNLEKGICNLAILHSKQLKKSITYIPCFEDQLCLVVPSNHPLAKNKTVSLMQFENEPFIISDIVSLNSIMFFEACSKMGIHPNIAMHGINTHITLEYIRKGIGVSFLFKHEHPPKDTYDLTFLECEFSCPIMFYFAYANNRKLTKTADDFIQYAQAAAVIPD